MRQFVILSQQFLKRFLEQDRLTSHYKQQQQITSYIYENNEQNRLLIIKGLRLEYVTQQFLFIQQKIMTQNIEIQAYPKQHEFKNAFHFGFITNTENKALKDAKFSELKSPHSISKDGEFSRYSPRQARNNNAYFRQTIQKIGLTIDDEGNLLLAEWQNGKIEGKYFLFKPSASDNYGYQCRHMGICQYGWMSNGILDGDNYLYDINGNIAKSTFNKDKIGEKCYLFNKSKLTKSKDIKGEIQCQVINFPSQNHNTQVNNDNKKKYIVPPFKILSARNHEKKLKLETQLKDESDLVNPISFLQLMVSDYQTSNQNKESKIILDKIQINQQYFFIGFIRSPETAKQQSKQKLSESQNLKKINGWGLLLKNNWPQKYGYFELGKLQGSGRNYATELNYQDGFFRNDQLAQGFIYDYYNRKTFFGSCQFRPYPPQKKSYQFVIKQSFDVINQNKMLQYKKAVHLKALSYNNNYFSSPSLIYRSPWPVYVAQTLLKNDSIRCIIKQFRPQFDLSDIQIKIQTTENRVEKDFIKSIDPSMTNSQILTARSKPQIKTIAIKNGINNYLRQKQSFDQLKNIGRQIDFKKNIKEYNKIVNRKQQQCKIQNQDHIPKSSRTFRQKSKQTRNQSGYYRQITQNPTQKNKSTSVQTQTFPQQIDFSDLINEYNKCQTQKKSFLRQNFMIDQTNKKTGQIKSKRQMMKQDHQIYNQLTAKRQTGANCHPKYKQSTLRLDMIYREHFKH